MTDKRKVKDSELEQVNGGGGVMDPPNQDLAEAEGVNSGESVDLETKVHNLGDDMITTTPTKG